MRLSKGYKHKIQFLPLDIPGDSSPVSGHYQLPLGLETKILSDIQNIVCSVNSHLNSQAKQTTIIRCMYYCSHFNKFIEISRFFINSFLVIL